jgi:hypothetical protein
MRRRALPFRLQLRDIAAAESAPAALIFHDVSLQAVPGEPAGKKPLMVILDEDLIKAAKIAAIEDAMSCWRDGY